MNADAENVGAHLLSQGSPASALLARARQLEMIQSMIRDWAQAPLASALRIANERGGVVVLHVDSAAALTQLRFRQQELLQLLRQRLDSPSLQLEIQLRPASQIGRSARV